MGLREEGGREEGGQGRDYRKAERKEQGNAQCICRVSWNLTTWLSHAHRLVVAFLMTNTQTGTGGCMQCKQIPQSRCLHTHPTAASKMTLEGMPAFSSSSCMTHLKQEDMYACWWVLTYHVHCGIWQLCVLSLFVCCIHQSTCEYAMTMHY